IRHFSLKIGRTIKTIDPSALQELVRHPWPGNVREMQNIMERAVLLAKGDVISQISLPTSLGQKTAEAPASSAPKTMEEMERDHILTVLKKCNHRISGKGGAAEYL